MKLNCDICGKEGVVAIIMLEGAKMNSCTRCTAHGKVIYNFHEEIKESKSVTNNSTKAEEVEEIAENFGRIIRSGCDKLGLPMAVVAERINEKESYLENIERGHIKPTLSVARKLEKELGIKIIEKIVEEVTPTTINDKELKKDITLADFIVEKKKK